MRETLRLQKLLVATHPQESLHSLPLMLVEVEERQQVLAAVANLLPELLTSGADNLFWRELHMLLDVPLPGFSLTQPPGEADAIEEKAPAVTPEPIKQKTPVVIPEPIKQKAPAVTPEPIKQKAPAVTPEPIKQITPVAIPEPIKQQAPAVIPEPIKQKIPAVTPAPVAKVASPARQPAKGKKGVKKPPAP